MQEINQSMKNVVEIYKANILSISVYEKRGNVSHFRNYSERSMSRLIKSAAFPRCNDKTRFSKFGVVSLATIQNHILEIYNTIKGKKQHNGQQLYIDTRKRIS